MNPAHGPIAVTLDGVDFTSDPIPYDPLKWAKRDNRQPGSQRSSTIQDFGMTILDDTLLLASGDKQVLDMATVIALYRRYIVQGATYAFTDWLGNAFTVYIHDFHPVPKIRGRLPSGATETLFTYTMELWVVSCTALLGKTYTDTPVPTLGA